MQVNSSRQNPINFLTEPVENLHQANTLPVTADPSAKGRFDFIVLDPWPCQASSHPTWAAKSLLTELRAFFSDWIPGHGVLDDVLEGT